MKFRLWLMKKLDYFVGIPLCFLLGTAGRIGSLMSSPLAEEQEIRRLLLVKSWGVGNLIILLPILRGIRAAYPRAQIVFLTLSQNRGALDDSPDVDEVVYLDVSGIVRFLRSVFRAVRNFRSQGFDWVLDFDQFARATALLTWLSGARRRAGLDTAGQGRAFVYTHWLPYNDHQHTYLTFNDVTRMIGVDCRDAPPVPLPVSRAEEERVEAVLRENAAWDGQLLVGIHVGSGDNFPHKRWPVERFAEVGVRLFEKYQARIVLSGTDAERGLVAEAKARMPEAAYLDLTGRLTLRELAALIRRCDLFLSNDTAPMHLAAMMGTPCVCFFGPTTPVLYGPRIGRNLIFYKALPCSPCITNFNAKSSSCNDPVCMNRITVDEVMSELQKLLDTHVGALEAPEYANAKDA